MARQEIDGDRWDQSFGRDLLPPSLWVGFITRPPTSESVTLCAKFGEQRRVQRPTFNEFNSRSSITLMHVDPCYGSCITKDV